LYELAEVPLARETLRGLGSADVPPADFFEAYSRAIEERAAEREQYRQRVTPEIRRLLLDLLVYFEAPSDNPQTWPHDGLRALAMMAPLHVASNILWIDGASLDYAITTQRPGRPWAWWRLLGADLLEGGSTSQELAVRHGVSVHSIRRYALFLLGHPLGPKPKNREEAA